jgi:UDP-N-acetylglucosamine--N-acetylmuramyl-(pentapeptide) pyrophosphoryl-undecaprenol N-acetylglucosamine transferase
LLIAGGGTGGHLYPGVAVAEELLSRDAAHSVLFAGTSRGLEARVLPRLGLPFVAVRAAGLGGTGVRGTLRALGLLLLGLIDAARILRHFRPQACLGVGGYVSFPVVALARLAGVPSAVQEQNARPGLTNRVLAKIIQRVYAGDPDAVRHFPARKTRLTGNPLRRELTTGLPYTPPGSETPVRILVVGGSQGARALNEAVPRALDAVGLSIEVLHQAGRDGTRDVAQRYGARPGTRVVDFIDDMVEAYGWAHLVVARSGALTVAELAAAGRPAVLIPFPHAAGGHQEANARAAEDRGAAVCLLEAELNGPRPGEGLARTLESLLGKPDRLAAMARAAAAAARRGAARLIVDDLLLLGEKTRI